VSWLHLGRYNGGVAEPSYNNRRAHYEYELMERFEAGLVLRGSEVKVIRIGGVDFRDAFARFERNQLLLDGLYIPPYDKASYNNHDPRRARVLLLNQRELGKISEAITRKGLTIVPVRMYFTKGLVKVEIAIARGKKLHDKRQAERDREVKREMERYR
jgi:SsrA-binding protein